MNSVLPIVGSFLSATIAAVVAIFVLGRQYRNGLRLAARQAHLDRVNKQITEFYGPLLALSSAGRYNVPFGSSTTKYNLIMRCPLIKLHPGGVGQQPTSFH
jgi:hypothetical protein